MCATRAEERRFTCIGHLASPARVRSGLDPQTRKAVRTPTCASELPRGPIEGDASRRWHGSKPAGGSAQHAPVELQALAQRCGVFFERAFRPVQHHASHLVALDAVVFSNSGMNMERSDLGDVRSVDPL